jgi:hypothetical protein
LNGNPSSGTSSHLQNAVKNNFCATAATPKIVTPKFLIDKQSQTHIPTGQGKEPASRTDLQSLGEGTLVRMKAFIIEAHFSDVGAGESVNCNMPTEDDNDIHIALGATASTGECGSVTAEISPHFRLASWRAIGTFERFDSTTHAEIVNKAVADRLQAQPLRFTGQLFFDASHTPCPCGTPVCHPLRSSDWEIHPIYSIDVCKSGTACDESRETDWVAFDTWWNSAPSPSARPAKKTKK